MQSTTYIKWGGFGDSPSPQENEIVKIVRRGGTKLPPPPHFESGVGGTPTF